MISLRKSYRIIITLLLIIAVYCIPSEVFGRSNSKVTIEVTGFSVPSNSVLQMFLSYGISERNPKPAWTRFKEVALERSARNKIDIEFDEIDFSLGDGSYLVYGFVADSNNNRIIYIPFQVFSTKNLEKKVWLIKR